MHEQKSHFEYDPKYYSKNYFKNLLYLFTQAYINMQGPKMCKYGDNCPFLAKGSCKFAHSNQMQGGRGGYSPQNQPGQYNQGSYQRGGQGGRPNYGDQRYGQDQGGRGGNFQGGRGDNYQGGRGDGYRGPRQGGGRGDFRDQGQRPMGFNNQPGEQITNKFCRNFQLGLECKYQEKCNREHQFTLKKNLRRIYYDGNIPNHAISKLGTFVHQGKRIFSIRLGLKITLFGFNFSKAVTQDLGFTLPLPSDTVQYDYYSHRDKYIYFAWENKVTGLSNFGVINITTQKTMFVEQAHQGSITSLLHFTQNIILSASLDGQIKVWKVQGEKIILDKLSTEQFQVYAKDVPKKPQIIFLELNVFQSMNIISAGTSDGRILFWIGNELKFFQQFLDKKYTNIYAVRYTSFENVSVAIILAWAQNLATSGLFALNLQDFSQFKLVKEVGADPNDHQNLSRKNIWMIQIIGDLLLATNSFGRVYIYSLPSFDQVGVIMHNNNLSNMLVVEQTTQTNITTTNLFVLESIHKNHGSLAVYLYKP